MTVRQWWNLFGHTMNDWRVELALEELVRRACPSVALLRPIDQNVLIMWLGGSAMVSATARTVPSA